jgi:hypothetical protein
MSDPYMRLTEFRRDHPSVVIGTDDFGNWQAQIPRQSGERFLGGRELEALLDDLDAIMAGKDPMRSG